MYWYLVFNFEPSAVKNHCLLLGSVEGREGLATSTCCKQYWKIRPSLRSPGIDSASPAARYEKIGLTYGPARLGIDSWTPEQVYKYGLCIQSLLTYVCSKLGGTFNTLCGIIKYMKNMMPLLNNKRTGKAKTIERKWKITWSPSSPL
jgi:hypothetical protein